MTEKQKEIITRLFELVKDNTSLDLSDYYTIEDFEKVNNWYEEIEEKMTEELDCKFTYYSDAIDYLIEEEGYTSWADAFDAASNMGFSIDDMDICKLAYAYAYENESEKLAGIFDDINELQEEFEDIEE